MRGYGTGAAATVPSASPESAGTRPSVCSLDVQPGTQIALGIVLLIAAFCLRKDPRLERFAPWGLVPMPPIWAKVFFWIGAAVIFHGAARAF
jgi:hypothetical protein